MRRERALAGGAVALLIAALFAAALVPGATADTRDEHVRPSHLGLVETTIAAGEVTGSTATLSVTAHVAHAGGPADNVTVVVRATDAETGFVAATERTAVGDVRGERELQVPVNVTVERDGGYDVEAFVYEDGRRVAADGLSVRGVGTLTPAYARSAVQFHAFEASGSDLPVITYAVENVSGDRAALDVSAYVTNTGDDAASDLRLTIRARQVDSNIVADERTVPVGEIRPGRTGTPSVVLEVPDGYNYYLDAVLRRDGVIVDTATAPARLDPTETVPVNETRRSVGLETGDFATTGGSDGTDGQALEADGPGGATTVAGGPGFGAGVAVAAVATLAGAGMFARRRSEQ